MKSFNKHFNLNKILFISLIFFSGYANSMCNIKKPSKGYLNIKNCSNTNVAIVYYITEEYAHNELLEPKSVGKPVIIKLAPNESLEKKENIRLWRNDNMQYYVADLDNKTIPESLCEQNKLINNLTKQIIPTNWENKWQEKADNALYVKINEALKPELVNYNNFHQTC